MSIVGNTIPLDVLVKRFWRKVSLTKPCWVWTGAKDRHGYGLMWNGERLVLAHRLSFRVHFGEFDESLHVCHTCDNPLCVYPGHLWSGTNAENTKDKVLKSRQRRGERTPNAVLTAELVPKLRARHAAGETLTNIAASVGVDRSTVGNAVRRKTWAHI